MRVVCFLNEASCACVHACNEIVQPRGSVEKRWNRKGLIFSQNYSVWAPAQMISPVLSARQTRTHAFFFFCFFSIQVWGETLDKHRRWKCHSRALVTGLASFHLTFIGFSTHKSLQATNQPTKSFFLLQMNLLLKEYLVSGDISEAEHCLRDLEVPHFHHELVYEVCGT